MVSLCDDGERDAAAGHFSRFATFSLPAIFFLVRRCHSAVWQWMNNKRKKNNWLMSTHTAGEKENKESSRRISLFYFALLMSCDRCSRLKTSQQKPLLYRLCGRKWNWICRARPLWSELCRFIVQTRRNRGCIQEILANCWLHADSQFLSPLNVIIDGTIVIFTIFGLGDLFPWHINSIYSMKRNCSRCFA